MNSMSVNVQKMMRDCQKTPNAQKKPDAEAGKEEFKKLLKESPERETEAPERTVSEREDGGHAECAEQQDMDETLVAVQMGQMLFGNCVAVVPEELAAGQPELEAVSPEGISEVQTIGNGAEDTISGMVQNQEVPGDGQSTQSAGAAEYIENGGQQVNTESSVKNSGQAEVVPKETKQDAGAVKKQDDRTGSAKEEPSFAEGNPALEEAAKAAARTGVQKSPEGTKQAVRTENMHVDSPEEIPQKLSEELLNKVSAGVKEFEIQVEPEHLGKISIKVLYENGQTTVMIACSERQTQNLIGERAAELGQVMERNLGEETTVYVEEQTQDYLNENQKEQDHSGRESEQDRQREEIRKQKSEDPVQFLQKLRLGLSE